MENVDDIATDLKKIKTIEDGLQISIKDTTTKATNDKKHQEQKTKNLRSEFSDLEPTTRRTENLNLSYNSLITITPTSVECKRVFSGARNFVLKTRSRLCDNSIDAIKFLKSHFFHQKKKYIFV